MYEAVYNLERVSVYDDAYQLRIYNKFKNGNTYQITIESACVIVKIDYSEFQLYIKSRDRQTYIGEYYIESDYYNLIKDIANIFNEKFEPINVMEKLAN